MSVVFGNYDLNAEEFSIKTSKKYAEHHFLGVNGSHLEDLGSEAVVISGRGKYFGNKTSFNNLRKCVHGGIKSVHINGLYKGTGMLTKIDATVSDMHFVEFNFEIVIHTKINSVSSVTKKKSVTKYKYYKTKKKNQNLDKIVKNMNKKYKKKWTVKEVMRWNKIKNKKKIPKGKKLKFKYKAVQKIITKVN